MPHGFEKKTTLTAAGTLILLLLGAPAWATDHSHHQHAREEGGNAAPGAVRIDLPDTVLTDQDGKSLKFASELVSGRLVAINFVYTTCTTVCPVQSAVFADVQKRLGGGAGDDVVLLSLTVDPLRDTPAVLRQFAARYRAGPGWRFLTGDTPAVREVLEAFGAYTANFADHPAMIVVGDPQTGEWVRFLGFASADAIVDRLQALRTARAATRPAARPSASKGTRDPKAYFTDTQLITQDGRTVRFYSDVLGGRVVVANVMFTSCTDACPLITRQLVEVRRELGDLFGSRVHFVSITSDPLRDTPAAMKKFAQEQSADSAGWMFLTGARDDVYGVLGRLGARPEDAEDHITVLYILDVDNRRMRRMLPNQPPAAIAEAVRLIASGPEPSDSSG